MSNIGERGKNNGFSGGHRGNSIVMAAPKAKDFKKTVIRLLEYLGKYKTALLIVFILAVISTVLSILGPIILGKGTDRLVEGVMLASSNRGSVDFEAIGKIMIVLAVLYILSSVFLYIQGYVVSGIADKLTRKMRTEIDQKIHRLPFSYYDRHSTGDILSIITNDVDTINQSFNQSITQVITSITTVAGILIMMIVISWQMTLAALISFVVSLLVVGVIMKISQKYFKRQQDYLGQVNGSIEEIYSAHIIVKSFCAEEKSIKEFQKYNSSLYSSAWKANFLSGLMMPIMHFIANLGYVAVCIVGAVMAVRNAVSIGGIQAFVQYMRQFTQPLTQISQIFNIIQQTIAASERVFDFLDEEEEDAETDDMITVGEGGIPVIGNIDFQNVSFGYSNDKLIINNFNISVKEGQKIAIVGPTGAGKTTIVKLLMRFYEIDHGRILLDGNDIKTIKKDSLRSVFGMVLQDTWLYNATIEDNIRYGKLNSSKDEILKAAKVAQVHHFVQTLPDGYKMHLNEDSSNISQGQKQLLTIARVILANPKILILDEATSSVDTRTEVMIQRAMDHLMEGRTSFIIAHRLSTIKNADVILVMNKGDIVEQGTHDELISSGGFYADIYNSQFAHQEL